MGENSICCYRWVRFVCLLDLGDWLCLDGCVRFVCPLDLGDWLGLDDWNTVKGRTQGWGTVRL